MTTWRTCTRCVMDTSVSDIEFDTDGVCSYCRAASGRLAKEHFIGEAHRGKLDTLVMQIKREGAGKPYDCIIGVSGGVDSSYVAYVVKRQLGLRPLAVHFDNGWNSDLAVDNIERLLSALDIDLYTHVVDWEEFRDLQLAFLKSSVPNSEIPTDHAIAALLYRTAARHGVRFILHGGNLATESIMPAVWMRGALDLRFIRAIHRRFGTRPLTTYPVLGLAHLAYHTFVRRTRFIGILNYIEYNKNEAIEFMASTFGWRRYEGKHFESVFTRWFQGYLLPAKYGMDKRRPHYASLIVSGQMTRDAALEALQHPIYDPEIAKDDVRYVCRKFGLSEPEFEAIMRAPVRVFSDYPNSAWLLDRLSPFVRFAKSLSTGRLK